MPLLPPEFLDAVVAIGVGDNPSKREWVGTGFFYGISANKKDSDGNPLYGIFLISNRHVFQGRETIWVKVNAADDSPAKDYRAKLKAGNGRPVWVGHPDDSVDVAALSINMEQLQSQDRKVTFFNEDQHVLTQSRLDTSSIAEGDGVFMLGFPLGIVDRDRQFVICRSGSVARIQDVRSGRGKEILVDGLVFPGNSGGPVLTKPEVVAVGDYSPHRGSDLLGIVAAYIPYQETAISEQTHRPRMIFEENSGLTSVLPAQLIHETAHEAKRRLRSRMAQRRHQEKKRQSTADGSSTVNGGDE